MCQIKLNRITIFFRLFAGLCVCVSASASVYVLGLAQLDLLVLFSQDLCQL